MHGIKRRSIGLFKSSSTLSLLQKISKECPQAVEVLKMCDEYDKAYCNNQTNNASNSQQNFIPSKLLFFFCDNN